MTESGAGTTQWCESEELAGTIPAQTPDRCAVSFVASLRAAGLDVPLDATITFARALTAVGLASSTLVYWAGRATLVQRPEDVTAYDACFSAFWLGTDAPLPTSARAVTHVVAVDDAGEAVDDAVHEDPLRGDVTLLRYSRQEILRHKDFARCTPAELDEVRRLLDAVRLGGPARRTRRRRPSRRGDALDLRRTVRHALRSGGDPVHLERRARRERPRRIVLLCDVSGSMAPYSRALLQFMHVAVAGRRQVEAFTMGTRLTRVTRALANRDTDLALAATADAVPDWSGGTRLGESVRALNECGAVPGVARGAVVVILSDGWDRGDPDVLANEMARLARAAHRVVWVNPLKASPGFQPVARGMAAALPHVDDLVTGHSVASLEELASLVTGEGRSRRRARRPAAAVSADAGEARAAARSRPNGGG